MPYENPCFHAYWLLCFKFQLSGTGIYDSPFVACFFSQLPFPFCNLALHIMNPDSRFPFIICALLVILLFQKIPEVLIIQISLQIPGIILRLHGIL